MVKRFGWLALIAIAVMAIGCSGGKGSGGTEVIEDEGTETGTPPPAETTIETPEISAEAEGFMDEGSPGFEIDSRVYQLGYTYNADESRRYVTKNAINLDAFDPIQGQKVPYVMALDGTQVVNILEVQGGVATITIETEKVESAAPADEEVKKTLDDQMEDTEDTEIQGKFDRRGQGTEITTFGNEAAISPLGAEMSDDGLRIGLMGVLLPEGGVSQGDTWESGFDFDIGAQKIISNGTVENPRVSVIYELLGVDSDRGVAFIEIKMDVAPKVLW